MRKRLLLLVVIASALGCASGAAPTATPTPQPTISDVADASVAQTAEAQRVSAAVEATPTARPTPTPTHTPTPTATAAATVEPKPTPPPPPTARPVAPTETPSPIPTPVPSAEPGELEALVLQRLNEERSKSGLGQLEFGTNSAAQSHAESMIFFDDLVPWTTEGLKPYSSYSLAGGSGVQSQELFIYGWTNDVWISEGCDSPQVICEVGDERVATVKVTDLIINGGDIDHTVLGPDNSLVNIGIQISDRLVAIALQFEAFRLVPATKPRIQQREFSLNADFGATSPVIWDSADLYYDPPRALLDANSAPVSNTYCYGGGLSIRCRDPLMRIWVPPEPGFTYTDLAANDVVADRWDVTSGGFRLEADLADNVTDAGIYTLVIWDATGTSELLEYSFEYNPAADPPPTPTPTPIPSPLGERSFADRPDDPDKLDDPQVHLIYLLASDSDDLGFDLNGTIDRSITAINGWLFDESPGYRLTVDTFEGAPDITFLQLHIGQFEVLRLHENPINAFAEELGKNGLDDPNKIYLAYYGGLSEVDVCGRGGTDGRVSLAIVHLGRDCPAAFASADGKMRASDYAAAHELFHAMGAVPSCAPNYDGDDGDEIGHISDWEIDLMWPSSSGDQFQSLDLGRDDYFGHDNEGCLDVADSPFLIPPAD